MNAFSASGIRVPPTETSDIMNVNQSATAPEPNHRVLIVDDSADTRRCIADCLTAEKIPCLCASTGEEAIALLQTQRIAVVLLDWVLVRGEADASFGSTPDLGESKPGALNGRSVLEYCNRHHPGMPVIVMSSNPQPFESRTDALMANADGYLGKPFSNAVLTAYVRSWLRRVTNFPQISLPTCEQDIRPWKEIKARYIRHVVRLLDGNVSRAAKALELNRETVTKALAAEASDDSPH